MNGRLPQFRVIAEYLEEGIKNRKFDPSRRLPSDMELARKFSASRPTVVRAMIELQNRGLVERRVGSGTYIRTVSPQDDANRAERGSLGLIVAGLGNTEILDPICAEISRQSEALGFIVYRGESAIDADAAGFSEELADAMVRRCVEKSVRGVFFAPLELADYRAALNRRVADSLVAAGVAVVLLDREANEFPARSPYDLVGIDNFAAAYELGLHLVDAGRRRIRFVALPRYPSTTDLRMAGVREALLNRGLPCGDQWAHIGDPASPDFVNRLLLPEAPDAVVCSNDRTAAMLMQTLIGRGLRIPADIAVAGFDDVRYATLLSPPLTTMRQPFRDIGIAAVQLMASRLADPKLPPRTLTLAASLIRRRSTEPGV